MLLYAYVPNWTREIPDHLKTQEVCDEVVRINQAILSRTHFQLLQVLGVMKLHVLPHAYCYLSPSMVSNLYQIDPNFLYLQPL